MIANFPERFEILKAAINRFFDDGCYGWDIKSVKGILKSDWPEEVDPKDPAVLKKIKEWEALGIIKFIGSDDCFFKVLKKFERESGKPRISCDEK